MVIFIYNLYPWVPETWKGTGEIERHLGAGIHRGVESGGHSAVHHKLAKFKPLLYISSFGVRAAPADEFHQRVSGFSVIGPVKNRVATLSWPVFSIMIHVIS